MLSVLKEMKGLKNSAMIWIIDPTETPALVAVNILRSDSTPNSSTFLNLKKVDQITLEFAAYPKTSTI